MGVQGLWQLLEPSGRRLNIELLSGKVLAVDASIWITQFIKAMRDERGEMIKNAHLLGFFRRICKMLFHKIKPVFVFDGGTPSLKKRTLVARRRRREVQEAKIRRVAEKLLLDHMKKSKEIKPTSFSKSADGSRTLEHSSRSEKEEQERGICSPPASTDDKGLPNLDLAEEGFLDDNSMEEKKPSGSESCPGEDNMVFIPGELADMDLQALSALPPSMQYDILLRMREEQNVTNREQFTQAKDPSDFSSMQVANYLKSTKFKQSIDEIRGKINAEFQTEQEASGKPIMTEAGRQYVLETGLQASPKKLPRKRKNMEELFDRSNCSRRPALIPEEVPPWLAKRKENDPRHNSLEDRHVSDVDVLVQRDPSQGADQPSNHIIEIDFHQAEEQQEQEDELFGLIDSQDDKDDGQKMSSSANPPRDWRERAATRQKFWSLAHGFKLGRKLSDWAVQEDEEDEDALQEAKDLELALKLSLQDVNSEAQQSHAPVDDEFEWVDVDAATVPAMCQGFPPGKMEDPPIPSKPSISVVPETTGCAVAHGKHTHEHGFPKHAIFKEKATGSTSGTILDKEEPPPDLEDSIADHIAGGRDPHCVNNPSASGDDGKPSHPSWCICSVCAADGSVEEVRQTPTHVEATSPEKHAVNDGAREDFNKKTSTQPKRNEPLPDIRTVPSSSWSAGLGIPDQETEAVQEEEEELREMRRAAGTATDGPTKDMFQDVMQLLAMFGIPYVIAPMEAEAQCAWLNEEGLVDGVVTDDSDAFLFGSRCVYRNMFEEKKYVEEYQSSLIEEELGLDREKLIHLALLLGSDYTEGIHGVGIVNAIEIVHAFPGLEGLCAFRDWVETPDLADVQPNKEPLQEQEAGRHFKTKHAGARRNWEVNASFPSSAVIQAYAHPHVERERGRFTWGRPDACLLLRFCSETFGWDPVQSESHLRPVFQSQQETYRQSRVEEFFQFKERFARIRSRRIRSAVEGITGKKKGEI